jgi:hypothetical protein
MMEVLGSEIKVGQSIFAPPYGWIEVTAIDKTDQGFLVITGACDSAPVAKVRKICGPSSRFTVAEQHATASTNADEFCTHDRSPDDWDDLLDILAATKSEIKEKKTGGGPPARPPAEAHDDPWG